VKVVDFGLGKVLHGDQGTTGLTEQGMIFGTPEYMAPEMASGDEVDARADLYAAGVMLYEMAVGEVPFKARSAVGTMTAHLHDPLPSPRKARPDAHIPPALEAVILRSLAKSPADRYATARELAEAIAAARDEPRVIRPSGVTSTEEIAESDTDLHLERQSIGQARTLRAEEVAAITAAEQEGGAASAPLPAVVRSGRPQEIEVPTSRPAKRAAETPLPVPVASPRQGGYVWAVVAIVAAVVGVAIGVLVGMR
jgi:serine/threonine-protein kinase